MQDKPDLTKTGTTPTSSLPSRTQCVLHWFRRRRKTITFHVLRGVCYGVGASGTSVIAWWIEHH